jgi:iron(III) transport system ATP-binding protein
MSHVEVRAVDKSFGSVRVLDGVELDVPAGSLTAVLGPSGCGKTTLLRLIAGFMRVDVGTISFDGEIVCGPGRHVPAQRRRVGYVPQEGALFPHLDVAANVAFGLPRRERRRPQRTDELLELVGLDPSYRRRFPHELSGGQQQRIALARALAPRPSIVLLDEPFASLDTRLRHWTGRAVADGLRAAGATAVLVTHDQSEALSLADQVAVMRDGRIVQAGRPDDVYRAPVDPGVAAFVGGAVVLPATVNGRGAVCALGALQIERAPAGAGHVNVLIRPEQIELRPADDPEGVPAQVDEVSYFGHDAAVRLDVLDGGPRVLARVLGSVAPTAGSVVRLVVRGPVTAYDQHHARPSTGA